MAAAAVNAEQFEQVIRVALGERDRQRRARLLDRDFYAVADAACVSTIMTAAGYDPPEAAGKAIRRGRRATADNQAAAFGEVD
jgi:hypothetical protein